MTDFMYVQPAGPLTLDEAINECHTRYSEAMRKMWNTRGKKQHAAATAAWREVDVEYVALCKISAERFIRESYR